MKVHYPVAVEPGDDNTTYGVIVPDIPGCFSAGDTLEEALNNVKEAIVLQLEAVAEQGEDAPVSSDISPLKALPDYQGFQWFLIEVSVSMPNNSIDT